MGSKVFGGTWCLHLQSRRVSLYPEDGSNPSPKCWYTYVKLQGRHILQDSSFIFFLWFLKCGARISFETFRLRFPRRATVPREVEVFSLCTSASWMWHLSVTGNVCDNVSSFLISPYMCFPSFRFADRVGQRFEMLRMSYLILTRILSHACIQFHFSFYSETWLAVKSVYCQK
jgi:hypothetical protein